MSAAAEESVNSWTHPKVKGSRRELLKTIAKLIPDGQTTTAPIAIEELAKMTGYYEKAIRQARDVLVTDVGVLRIVDGGRGRRASYELLLLPGSGAEPTLPLRSSALITEVRTPKTPAPSDPDLFDCPIDVDETADGEAIRADDIGTKYRTHRTWLAGIVTKVGTLYRPFVAIVTKVGTLYRPFVAIVTKVGTLYRTRFQKVGTKYRTPLPLDVDDARARDVHTFKNVHTHTAAAPPSTGPPALVEHPWHAWCDGRVHVPKALHLEFLAKMGRLAGETDVAIEARLVTFYAETCAAIPDDESIASNDYQFWRRAFTARFGNAAAPRIESTRREGVTNHSVCPHEPMCETRIACIDRTLEDGRVERARQTAGGNRS